MTHSAEPNRLVIDLKAGPVAMLEAGTGQTLLLLHHDVGPFGWTEFHRELARDFRVVAIDLPGWGDSPRAEWAGHTRDLAAMVLHTSRKLGLDRYALVGTGFGGWVAAEMLAFACSEITSAVLIGPAGLKPEGEFIRDQVLEEHFSYLRAGFSTDEHYERYVPDPKDKDLRARLDSAREVVARVCWKPYMYSYELPETLRDVETPVTVAWGTADAVFPPSTASLWKATLQNCRVRLVEGAGHFAELEQPTVVAEIVRSQALATIGKD